MKLVNVFRFRGITDLYCDENGAFFYKEKLIEKKYRRGQIYLQIEKKRYGILTLRKISYKEKKEIEKIPF